MFVNGGVGPHAFVPALNAPELEDNDRAHLAKSLRLRVGDALTLSDGGGRWRQCTFGPEIRVDGPIIESPKFDSAITIGVALAKSGKPELITQKLTELGVDRVVFFRATRSVVQWDAPKVDRNLSRLRKVAREAAMQSRRCVLPEIGFLDDLMALTAEISGLAIADRGGRPLTNVDRTVVIGPEGGWTDDERRQGEAVGLPGGVLRVETAAIVAGALATTFRGERLQ